MSTWLGPGNANEWSSCSNCRVGGEYIPENLECTLFTGRLLYLFRIKLVSVQLRTTLYLKLYYCNNKLVFRNDMADSSQIAQCTKLCLTDMDDYGAVN